MASAFKSPSKPPSPAPTIGVAPPLAQAPLVVPSVDPGDVAARARKRRASAAQGSILSDLDAEYLG